MGSGNQLDLSHGCPVTAAGHELERAGEPAWPARVAWDDLSKQLSQNFFVVQLRRSHPPGMQIIRSGHPDEPFDLSPQFSGFWLCRLQALVADEIRHQIANEG